VWTSFDVAVGGWFSVPFVKRGLGVVDSTNKANKAQIKICSRNI
jgi:hypothetical protein